MSQSSLADLEQKAGQRRVALSAAIQQLVVQAQPANLAREAAEGASARASETLQTVAGNIATPKGVGISIATIATGAALLAGWQTRLFGLLPQAPQPQNIVEPEAAPAPPPSSIASEPAASPLKGTFNAAAGLSAALAVGAALSKIVPVSEREQSMLNGVGDELKNQFFGWADKHVSTFVQSSSQNAPGWINLATTALGILAARYNASATPAADKPPEG